MSVVLSGKPRDGRPRRGVHVTSVARAMRVLETFAQHPDGAALSALSHQLGYGKAALSKILATLERGEFVRQDPLTGRFTLSWRLLALAFGHAHRVGVAALCSPILQALADETDELVQLAVIEREQVLFVAKAEGRAPRMRMLPLVGLVAPAHATASGKAWLARLPEREAVAVLDRHGMPRLAPRTITSRRRLLAELRAVRARGWAVVDEELAEGGRAIAAAIVCGGRVVGAVAVSGPVFRLTLAKLHALGPRLRRAAADLGAVWPLQASARDFGLGTPAGARANGHARPAARVRE